MRRTLRFLFTCLKWLGLGLSTILLVGTMVLWLRNIGHEEVWNITYYNPEPDWLVETMHFGEETSLQIKASGGKFWLRRYTERPVLKGKRDLWHWRAPSTSATAEYHILFAPGKTQDRENTWVQRNWMAAGAGYSCGHQTAGHWKLILLVIPFWMLAVVFGLWPLCCTAWRLLRRKRHAPGLCPHCGYDLRASPQRCPECGRAVVASTR